MAKIYRKVRNRKKSTYVSKGTGRNNQIRKRRPPKVLSAKQQLYRNTKNKINEVNRKLRNLNKEGYQGTWSSGKLLDRLSSGKLKKTKLIKTGKYGKKVVFDKNITTTKLIALNEAADKFLNSKTSTSRGIKKTKEATINSLGITFDISDEMAEVLYNMFDNVDMIDLTKNSNASTVWGITTDFLEGKIGQLDLIDRLYRIANVDYVHDKDMREKVNKTLDYLKKYRK